MSLRVEITVPHVQLVSLLLKLEGTLSLGKRGSNDTVPPSEGHCPSLWVLGPCVPQVLVSVPPGLGFMETL